MTEETKTPAPSSDTSSFTPVDLSVLQRDELVNGLKELLNVFQMIANMTDNIQNTQTKIDELESQKGHLRLDLPLQYTIVTVIIDLIYLLIAVAQNMKTGAIIVILLLAAICWRYLFRVFYDFFNSELLEEKRYQFYQEKIVPLKDTLKAQRNELTAFLTTDYALWASNALAEQYLSPDSIQTIIDYVKSYRADTLKEALNLYEEELYRRKMEAMLQQILESSKKTSEEINKQTDSIANLQQELKNTSKAVKNGNTINLLNFLK